ncbi:glycosyltransferase family 1 protein [Noviherbaspirillum sp. CPCC 100848]|uniref:Glycosyltransferase family 1 protein n=1 Tax=Noviherbaspirillum album TaxID=3080276 RepID=A0ABU6JAF8_9BURK|nr:glycosyltransferase family 1 protein [Noviherbaspirillum sp. CPCC 100848]MEC4720134.1 glycosyltransferase family 1 protein [Noviherbaspirillum sp. CPCC 100848]
MLQQEVLYCHGLQGWLACLEHDGVPASELGLTLNRRIIEGADRLLVFDQAQLDALQSANPGAWLPPAAVLRGEGGVDIDTYRAAIASAIDASQRHTLSNLADALAGTSPGDDQLQAIAAHAASNWRLRKQPRLLIDVTQLARSDLGSGIQRVVRNIASEILRMASPGQPVELVRQHEGKLWRAPGVVASLFGVPADSLQALEVTVQPGDTLLMIDSSWEQYADFAPVFQAVRQLGGRIVTVVYDLIPLQLPHTCIPALVRVFESWFPLAVQHSDMLLCISGAVADEVRAYIAKHQLPMPRQLEVTHWPLGADLTVRSSESAVRDEVRRMLEDTANTASPLFLMVGTLEPRKGHAFALQAFEQLWQQGSTARVCMAGSIGWLDAHTLDHIRTHPELGKRLFFIERFTDAEINLCYAAATGLIAASVAEGFGLPIVEAALHRVPALASDIPVFREVGGAGARYFSLEHPGHLAQAVTEFAAMPAEQRLEMAAQIPTVTWKQSARALLDVIGIQSP